MLTVKTEQIHSNAINDGQTENDANGSDGQEKCPSWDATNFRSACAQQITQ